MEPITDIVATKKAHENMESLIHRLDVEHEVKKIYNDILNTIHTTDKTQHAHIFRVKDPNETPGSDLDREVCQWQRHRGYKSIRYPKSYVSEMFDSLKKLFPCANVTLKVYNCGGGPGIDCICPMHENCFMIDWSSPATVSPATVSAATVSAATVSAETVSAETVSAETVSAETVSAPRRRVSFSLPLQSSEFVPMVTTNVSHDKVDSKGRHKPKNTIQQNPTPR
jgi:hypothetical protein